MSQLKSQISPRSEAFRVNEAAMRAAINEVEAAATLAMAGGGEIVRKRHTDRGKLLPRDRVTQLIDPALWICW